ncbi:hypothetical protein CPB84DRAFT_1792802, partial [Gymnopilus junonius]
MVDIQRAFSFAAGSAPVSAIGSTALASESPFVKLLLAVFQRACDCFPFYVRLSVDDPFHFSQSILEVFLLCAAGYILARHGIL